MSDECKRDDSKRAEIIVHPEAIVARDEYEAKLIAARMVPAEHASNLDRIEVLVRPF